jgi:hypothetical protein
LFTRESIAEAPEAPGVYALFENEGVIFYGSAFGGTITIRSCLGEHLLGSRGAASRSATHCAWEISLNPAARERALIDEHRAQHGRLPCGNEHTGKGGAGN